MRKGRYLPAKRFVKKYLLWRVGNMVFAPYDVGDLHAVVVHHDGIVVGGEPVALDQHDVLECFAGHLYVAVDHVVKGHHFVLGDREDHGLTFAVGLPRLHQPHGVLQVDTPSFGLPVRPVASAHVGPLVPVEAQPVQALEDGPFVLAGGTDKVSVLYAQDERAAVPAGPEPVEQCRVGSANMKRPCGAGCKTYPGCRIHFSSSFPGGILSLSIRAEQQYTPKFPLKGDGAVA